MGSALIISLRKRRIRCPTRSKHRLYLPFVRQKRRGLPKGPLHVRRGGPSAGSARSLVRPKRSALPETVPRGEAIHISAPLSLGCARCLFRPIFLCCSLYHAPGLFPCLFIFSLAGPARRRSPFSLPFGKKRKNPRPSMLRSLNEHRLLHLLYPCLSFLLYPYPKFLTSPRTCS